MAVGVITVVSEEVTHTLYILTQKPYFSQGNLRGNNVALSQGY